MVLIYNVLQVDKHVNHIEFHTSHHHTIVLAGLLDDYEMATLLSFYFFLLPLLCSFP